MKRHPNNESVLLYKKSLHGQREYKRSTPRFIAISDVGICLKWNKDIPRDEFESHAYKKLLPDTECGLTWDVCVLYRPSTIYKTREAIYFRVILPYLKDSKLEQRNRLLRRQVKKLRGAFMKAYKSKVVKTRYDFLNVVETLGSKLESS